MISWNQCNKRHGITLLELLIFLAVWAIVAVATMRVLGDSRVLRSNARDRSVMALLAQGELERIRLLPPAELAEGEQTVSRPDWPSGVSATVRIDRRDDGTWLVDVSMARESFEGKPSVRLTTIRSGAAPEEGGR